MPLGQFISHKAMIPRALFHGLNLLLPPLCGICGETLAEPGLCVDCFHNMRAITDPCCNRCGRPLTLSLPDQLCGNCLIKPMRLRYLRSAYIYNDASRDLLLPFKHAGQMHMAATLTALLLPTFLPLITDTHIVIAIPLHWRRLLHRRYNQSAEIARRLCDHAHHRFDKQMHYAPHYLRRTKPTEMLRGKSRDQRKSIVKSAFHVPDKFTSMIKGRPILLIDDVITTGATLEEAARTLKGAGAGSVDALTFARVL